MRTLVLLGALLASAGCLAAQQPEVSLLPPQLAGSRPIEPQTRVAVVRDYLASWDSMRAALAGNQAGLLDTDFVGTARTHLTDTISQQVTAGIRTTYSPPTHSLTFVFYSPEGTSIELIDSVSYTEEIRQGDHLIASQPIKTRYLVVLTPAQVRWQVRILQTLSGS